MSYNSLGCERLGDELLLAELAVFGMIDEFFSAGRCCPTSEREGAD